MLPNLAAYVEPFADGHPVSGTVIVAGAAVGLAADEDMIEVVGVLFGIGVDIDNAVTLC